MRNLFKTLFGKNDQAGSVFSSAVLDKIADYLYNNQPVHSINDPGFKENIQLSYFSFPSSFDDYPNTAKELKKGKFSDLYGVLNKFYINAGISPLSPAEIKEGLDYYYMQVELVTPPAAHLKGMLKSQRHYFFIVTGLTGEGSERFKILYYAGFPLDYLNSITAATLFDYKSTAEKTKELVKYLENALETICEYCSISTAKNKGVFRSFYTAPARDEFVELVGLLCSNTPAPEGIDAAVDELMLVATDPAAFVESIDNEEANMASLADDLSALNQLVLYGFLFQNSLLINSDWKFSAEDMEVFITELMGADFTFHYPPDTYGEDLFPYVQTALQNEARELINLDSNGDNYGFVVVAKTDVPRIIQLASKYSIPLETV